ncbi:MAG TPA: DUF805 domain-containing protein [Caulobacteraceae bacterium]|jgi:uncharacterized membrane protein YhaH (DUF805 family)|nr:DUF805 domain-containing protein [Caulobacteraceae bacterium]
MNYQELLFSFNGRIRRLHYWLAAIGAGVAYGVVAAICLMLGMMLTHGQGPGLIGGLLYVVVLFFAAWTGLALQIKRWHDRDKSWVWIFISLIPFIGAIWALVEVGFLDGTQGPNKYGASPKGIGGPAVAAAAAGPAA